MRKDTIIKAQGKLRKTGFYNVFSSSVINKIVNFAYGILLVRVISKADFGIYSYANNIYSYFALLLGLGISSALLQICSEDKDDIKLKNSHFRFCFSYSVLVNLILSFIIILAAVSVKLPINGSNRLLLMMGFLPTFTQFTGLFTNWLRANFDNKGYSYLNIVNTLLITVCSIGGALIGEAVGLIIGRYLAAVFTIGFATVVLKCPIPHLMPLSEIRSFFDKTKLMKMAFTICISESLVQVMSLIGVSILGIVIADESIIAAYKTATTLPTALAFISNSVMIYAYPYFARNRENYIWTKKYFLVLMMGLIGISGIVSVGGILFAKPIIVFLFGSQYLDSVEPFIILMVGFFINSVLRIPASNLVITQMKLKFSLIISVIGSALTIGMNVLLIPRFESIGAAYAQMITMLVIGIISTSYYCFLVFSVKND